MPRVAGPAGMMGAVGDQVTLRPVGEDDLPIMEKLTWDPAVAGEFARFGWFAASAELPVGRPSSRIVVSAWRGRG